MKKILLLIIGITIGGVIGIKASQLIESSQVVYKDNQTVDVALDNLFDELTNGKEKIAEAITNKGVTTTSDNTLEEMASNIDNIQNKTELPDITVKVQVQTTAYVTSSYNGTLVGDTVGTIDPTPFWELGYTKMIIGSKEYTNTTGTTNFTYISPRGSSGSSASGSSGYITITFTTD